nr:MAG TPA: hypothetical protein [Bacteriophage sp.]
MVMASSEILILMCSVSYRHCKSRCKIIIIQI